MWSSAGLVLEDMCRGVQCLHGQPAVSPPALEVAPITKKKRGQRAGTVDRVLALYLVNPGLNPNTPDSSPSTARSDP